MNYIAYKLKFDGLVHFGNVNLEDSNYTFTADTLFSALCHEAIKSNSIDKLINMVRSRMLKISDAFPYIGEELFLPKPYINIEKKDSSGDSVLKKAYKKLKYIQVSKFEEFLSGEYDVVNNIGIELLGKSQTKVSAAVRGEEETKPYRVGMYGFNEGNGLYIIVGYENVEAKEYVKQLLCGLSYSGIGGKRTSGLGRFTLTESVLPNELLKRFKTGKNNMTIAISLPADEELEKAMEDSQYSLIKKSGFVQSSTYAKEQRKKRDIYLFASGSCFKNVFNGDVYDVADGYGNHPIYKYAIPMFMEVDS